MTKAGAPSVPPAPEAPGANVPWWASGTLWGQHRHALASRFTRDVGATLATRVLVLALSTVTGIIVARALGPAGRGYYAVAVAVGGIGVQLGNVGLHASNTYYVARNRSLLPRLLSNSLVASFGLGGVGALCAMILFYFRPDVAPVWGWVMVLSLAVIPFSLAYTLQQNLLLGLRKIGAYNRVDVATSVLGLLLIGSLLVTGRATVTTVLLCSLATAVVSFAASGLPLLRESAPLPLPSRALFVDTLHYGTKAYLAALFGFLAQRVDLFIVQRMLGSEPTGYYSVAVSIGALLAVFPSVVGSLLFPRLSEMPTRAARWRVALQVAGMVAVVMTVATAMAALLAGPLIRLLFGVAFVPATPVLLWLLPGVVMLAVNSVLMNYFAADGMPLFTVWAWLAVTVLDVALLYALVPPFGIRGAAAAASISFSALLLGSLVYAFLTTREKAR